MVNYGWTQFEPDRTIEIVLPVPTLDQYKGFEMNIIVDPFK